ncbi:hypothetical protein NDU88_005219 [Pleurodeles waltl]|uniref:Uncharacterized protein n=1 Tax=Pleurodeles waltl TaxID=8319 RepID=A0AAV7WAU0_PLEWA|nr:hypothetical protein NDU88_005219 [Pleurodeles waltl]
MTATGLSSLQSAKSAARDSCVTVLNTGEWGAWPRIQRWHTPDFSLRRGRLENEKKRAISGPIGVHAEVLNWRPIPGLIGPPRWPRRVLAGEPGPAARTRAGGPYTRLKPRPRVEPRADEVRGRTARERRGTPDESPSYSRGAGGDLRARVKIRPSGGRAALLLGAGAAPGRGRGP